MCVDVENYGGNINISFANDAPAPLEEHKTFEFEFSFSRTLVFQILFILDLSLPSVYFFKLN